MEDKDDRDVKDDEDDEDNEGDECEDESEYNGSNTSDQSVHATASGNNTTFVVSNSTENADTRIPLSPKTNAKNSADDIL